MSPAYYAHVMADDGNGEGNIDDDDDENDYTAEEDEVDLGDKDAGSDGGFGAWAECHDVSEGNYTVDEGDEEPSSDEDDFTVDGEDEGSQTSENMPPTGASSSSEGGWEPPR